MLRLKNPVAERPCGLDPPPRHHRMTPPQIAEAERLARDWKPEKEAKYTRQTFLACPPSDKKVTERRKGNPEIFLRPGTGNARPHSNRNNWR
jgi:hypothetical protein